LQVKTGGSVHFEAHTRHQLPPRERSEVRAVSNVHATDAIVPVVNSKGQRGVFSKIVVVAASNQGDDSVAVDTETARAVLVPKQ